MRIARWIVVLGALWAQLALAGTVYVSRGEFGEVSFSDQASPGAAPLQITVREPSTEALARADRITQATLALADELAEARRAREAQRKRAQAPAARRLATLTPRAASLPEREPVRTVVWPFHRHHARRGPGYGDPAHGFTEPSPPRGEVRVRELRMRWPSQEGS
tara:strand:+ start:6102 stop:6593 length:492 start_codon:yes stop_codon:yes gene_type:complete